MKILTEVLAVCVAGMAAYIFGIRFGRQYGIESVVAAQDIDRLALASEAYTRGFTAGMNLGSSDLAELDY